MIGGGVVLFIHSIAGRFHPIIVASAITNGAPHWNHLKPCRRNNYPFPLSNNSQPRGAIATGGRTPRAARSRTAQSGPNVFSHQFRLHSQPSVSPEQAAAVLLNGRQRRRQRMTRTSTAPQPFAGDFFP